MYFQILGSLTQNYKALIIKNKFKNIEYENNKIVQQVAGLIQTNQNLIVHPDSGQLHNKFYNKRTRKRIKEYLEIMQ
jgi:hypothetical protein